jgi:hypothetical protein
MDPMDEMQTLEESRAFRRLRELLVLGQSHVSERIVLALCMRTAAGKIILPPQFNQDSLHGVVTLPLSETGKLGWVDLTKDSFSNCSIPWSTFKPHLSGALVDTGNVDSRDELNSGRIIGIVGAAVNVDTVYAVLMNALIVVLLVRHA